MEIRVVDQDGDYRRKDKMFSRKCERKALEMHKGDGGEGSRGGGGKKGKRKKRMEEMIKKIVREYMKRALRRVEGVMEDWEEKWREIDEDGDFRKEIGEAKDYGV